MKKTFIACTLFAAFVSGTVAAAPGQTVDQDTKSQAPSNVTQAEDGDAVAAQVQAIVEEASAKGQLWQTSKW